MKSLAWIFTLLPLAAIALYYLFVPRAEEQVTTDMHLGAPKNQLGASAKHKAEQLSDTRKRTDDQDDERRHLREKQLLAKLKENDEKLARIGERFTPDQQKKMLDITMRSREQSYRALFESWALDSVKIEQALKLVREREGERTALRVKFLKTGGANEFQKGRVITDVAAEVQLIDLLGQDRFDEFSRLESQMQSEAKRVSD